MADTLENDAAATRPSRKPRDAKLAGTIAATIPSKTEPEPARPSSKTSMVLRMLERTEGATIAQIVSATSWLPHTARAALTGLRKKGHSIVSAKTSGAERIYRVDAD